MDTWSPERELRMIVVDGESFKDDGKEEKLSQGTGLVYQDRRYKAWLG